MNFNTFAIAVFLFIQMVFALPSALAEGEKNDQKKHISKSEMLEIFKAGESDSKNGWVDGYEIDGKDIVEIIKEAKAPIRINNSIIRGGLDFTSIPATSIDKLTMPSNLQADGWTQWLEHNKKNRISQFIVILNQIVIHNSDIDGQVTQGFEASHRRVGILFIGDADFRKATFSGKVDLTGATFSRKAVFGGATFSGDADFSMATFSRYAVFKKATFSGDAYFGGATFRGDAYFSEATFRGKAYFHYVKFCRDAWFLASQFQKIVQFKDSIFSKRLRLDSMKIKEYANFRNTQIKQLNFYCRSIPDIIEGHVDFRNSEISEAHFEDIIFEKDVDFSNATFGLVVFRFITFGSDASFIDTNMNDCCAFENVNVKGVANFTRAEFRCSNCKNQKRFCLSHMTFNNLILRWNQLPDYRLWVTSSDERIRSFLDPSEAKFIYKSTNNTEQETSEKDNPDEVTSQSEKSQGANTEDSMNEKGSKEIQPLSDVFEQLEANFKKANQLDGANWAYYNRKESKRIEDGIGWSKPDNSKWLEWFEWITWGKVTGYCTKLGRVIGWCAGVYLIFAFVLYWGKPTKKGQRSIKHRTTEEQDSEFKQRFFDFPRKYMTNYTGLWKNKKIEKIKEDIVNSLWLSFVVFFKFGYGDRTISGGFFRFIMRLEWVLGWFFLAALVITITNTVPLLHSLLTGVFH
jgi:uncharacterized protein YjbI with pentapeptide repeats